MTGLGLDNVYAVKGDATGRMSLDDLEKKVEEAKTQVQKQHQQECISVGCVLPACCPHALLGQIVPGPRGCTQSWRDVPGLAGVPGPRGCVPGPGGGGVPGPGGRYTWSQWGVPGPGGCTCPGGPAQVLPPL